MHPLPNMVYSPLNIVPKAGKPGQWRLIHDLAYPYNNQSINSCIPDTFSSVEFHYLDEVVQMAQDIGLSAWGACIDIKHAFQNLPIHYDDLHTLGFTWCGLHYINSSLPFGMASSCAIFEKVATALQWVVSHVMGSHLILHYLDDFPLLAPSKPQLIDFMNQFYTIMGHIGMPLASDKTLGPTQCLPYLGLELDFHCQVLLIPEEKQSKCSSLIEEVLLTYQSKKKTTVKKIQKVAGSLNFICQALPAGKPFLHSLYTLTKSSGCSIRKSGHHRCINKQTYLDLQMFHSFLASNVHLSIKSVPFLSCLAIDNDHIELLADATGAPDKGFGCAFWDQWVHGIWQHTNLFTPTFKPNIALLELYAITVMLEIWANQLAGKTITLHSDNLATVCILNKKKANIPTAMSLLRHLTITCLQFQIMVKAKHIPGVNNVKADLISRGRICKFLHQFPMPKRAPTPLPLSLWPPTWTRNQMSTSSPDPRATSS